MAIIKKQISVCQELDEALSLIIKIVKDVKAGLSATEIAVGAMATLPAALTGVEQIKAEAEDKEALDATVALKLGELKRVLLPSLP